jgi:hypothetical protein
LFNIWIHVDRRPDSQFRTPRRSPTNRETTRTATVDDHLREVAQAATTSEQSAPGTIAGAWFSSTAWRGEDLIAARLLMLAGLDLDELDRWMRTGWERRRGADIP